MTVNYYNPGFQKKKSKAPLILNIFSIVSFAVCFVTVPFFVLMSGFFAYSETPEEAPAFFVFTAMIAVLGFTAGLALAIISVVIRRNVFGIICIVLNTISLAVAVFFFGGIIVLNNVLEKSAEESRFQNEVSQHPVSATSSWNDDLKKLIESHDITIVEFDDHYSTWEEFSEIAYDYTIVIYVTDDTDPERLEEVDVFIQEIRNLCIAYDESGEPFPVNVYIYPVYHDTARDEYFTIDDRYGYFMVNSNIRNDRIVFSDKITSLIKFSQNSFHDEYVCDPDSVPDGAIVLAV